MNGKLWLVAALALVLTAGSAAAQDMEPKKWDNLEWYRITNVSFEPGKMDEALDMIENYFMKAGEKAGTSGPDMLLINHTGDWDLTLVWKMKGGIADMEWEMSPDDAKWRAAMAEIAGGQEAARAKWQEYLALVDDTHTTIARAWSPTGEGDGE